MACSVSSCPKALIYLRSLKADWIKLPGCSMAVLAKPSTGKALKKSGPRSLLCSIPLLHLHLESAQLPGPTIDALLQAIAAGIRYCRPADAIASRGTGRRHRQRTDSKRYDSSAFLPILCLGSALVKHPTRHPHLPLAHPVLSLGLQAV